MINELSISEAFEQIGLSKRESAIYLTLASLGRAQAQLIAKKTRIPRPSTYHCLNRLVDRGLVFIQKSKGICFFVPHGPERLLQTLEAEEERLRSRRKVAENLVQVLGPKFQRNHYSVPSVQFFDGNENVRSMLSDYLDPWFTSMKSYDNVQWGFQDPSFVKHHLDWLKKYWKKMDTTHSIKIFSNDELLEQQLRTKVPRREIRPFGGEEMRSTLWVSGDYVTMIGTRQTPHYAFQIQDAAFAANLRSIFRRLWELSA